MKPTGVVRVGCAVLVVCSLTQPVGLPSAAAVPRPTVDPALVPSDGPPGPDHEMRQTNLCAEPVAAAHPDVAAPAPGFAALNVAAAWQYSTGAGVSVAVIDTGVNPNPRLAVAPGGDYVGGSDGLLDCDAHGTIVASIIAAAPRAIALPPAGDPAPVPAAGAPPRVLDGVAGVAPHATIVSIRQSSRAYQSRDAGPGDADNLRKAGTIRTLARAVVHAANLGVKVINVSVAACIAAGDPADQGPLGAAVWYAAEVKDVVIVAAAGNEGEDGCAPNPVDRARLGSDPRDWQSVKTLSSPSCFADYVLSVGAVDPSGVPIAKSLAGPWVQAAAPGTDVIGLSPRTGLPVNAYSPARHGDELVPMWGTSFAAAYVSGVAALVRARYPQMTAQRVIQRILQTSHNPARGVDNRVGHGMVDPVAALTFDLSPSPAPRVGQRTRAITPGAQPGPPDRRAQDYARVFVVMVSVVLLAAAAARRAGRAR